MPETHAPALTYDLAVIGAGPAGLAGAVAAASGGLRVALIDGGRQLGGQYYRHPSPGLGARHPERLHHGWKAFDALVERTRDLKNLDILLDHQVWAVESGFRIHATADRAAATVDSRNLLLATGAYERQIPFPGWDLPGVFTAGGAQALLKGNLVLAGKRVVVAGTGPLLLPVAAGLSSAGARVLGLYESNKFLGYAKHPVPLLTNPGKLVEGAGYARQLATARVPVRLGYAVVAAHADHDGELEAVTVARLDGSNPRRIECDALAVGYGLVPQIDIGLQLGCEHRLLADDTAALVVDDDQRTTVPGIWAAGETAGVAGAQTALVEGEIAGLAVAALGRDAFRGGRSGLAQPPPAQPTHSAPPTSLASLKRRRDRQRAFADVIASQHPVPPAWPSWLTPETTVCRCEEVPASALTEAADLGATDVRTVKLLTRAGMGWCQGRMCGYAVACLASGSGSQPSRPSPTDLLATAKRPLSRPVPLGLLAEDPDPSHPQGTRHADH